jgi:ketosteroid isomerase-like protein
MQRSLTFKDGKIIEFVEFLDTQRVHRLLSKNP